MPWPAISLTLTLLLLSVCFGPHVTNAEGNVGCLFSERLCLEEEWCYDDLAFGRCVPKTEDLNDDDLFRYNLEREGLHELSAELRRLFALGYRWSHGYTQCRLQAMLYAFKFDLMFEPNSCSHLSDNDLEGALKALEGQVDIDPREIAIIKYTPSVVDPHAKYADEVYYPPIRNHAQEELREKILGPNAIDLDLPDPYADYAVVKRNWVPQMHRRAQGMLDMISVDPRNVDSTDTLEFLQNYENGIPRFDTNDVDEIYPIVKFLNDMQLSPLEIRDILSEENKEKLDRLLERFENKELKSLPSRLFLEQSADRFGQSEPDERFTLNYNTPEKFRNGWESRDILTGKDVEDLPESRVYFEEEDNDNNENREYGSGHNFYSDQDLLKLDSESSTDAEIFRELNRQMNNARKQTQPVVYSEGGVVWSEPVQDTKGTTQEDVGPLHSFDELLLKYNMGFKRPERLDVKKPGPPFDAQITDAPYKAEDKKRNLQGNTQRPRLNYGDTIFANQDYIQLKFRNSLKNRSQGLAVLAVIRNILDLGPPDMIGSVSVPTQSVLLRIDPFKTASKLSTQEIVSILDDPDFKGGLEERMGLTLESVNYIMANNPTMVLNSHEGDTQENDILPSMMKKEPKPVSSRRITDKNFSKFDGEQDYVYLSFRKGFTAWKQGSHIIRNISELLHLEPGTFADGRVNPKSVVFRVRPNGRGLNASDVAKNIEKIKDRLKGVEITSVGVGDKENMQTVISVPLANEDQFYIVIFMVCGVLAALIIATVLLILIRRHLKSREKISGLSRPESEPSKDYQDLCRARMASKPQPASDTVHGRITSLSRESEQSPSSRSSTSSWSEEPALHNMDISTGHMVLSYMEDHLKNKDRLEQEWVALCAYLAEPCETSVAQKKENKDKNRYPEIVPYDHARVVLNELSNANGSDYINASCITDHDPRNPAYIATQGPLPHTAPDFWQLIWEQGAVVIVMLTRLTEGGTAMCHRYWPEEGSELYHIYEVHLVSEHIWCDDYLVRSFYLKNIRTGETRTVTQFHFLSWPDSGVPSSTKALLEFRRKVNKSYRGRSCPIVVHCSDGAGRTGTYCLIDMVLSRMAKGAKEIDIAATLEHLRDQRPKMVATKQQFEFVLTAVAEEVHAILKALPVQPQPATSQEKDK